MKDEKRKRKKKRRPGKVAGGTRQVDLIDVPDYNVFLKSEDDVRPAFFWPIYANDNGSIIIREGNTFPDDTDLDRSLQAAHTYEVSEQGTFEHVDYGSFWENVFNSHEVYIIDKFFSPKEFGRILEVIAKTNGFSLTKLTIVCYNHSHELRELRRQINDPIGIELHVFDMYFNNRRVSFNGYDESLFNIHDRFAWMDGEIWHFGSTVGGIKPHVTAYSRGWIDHGCKFRDYINQITKGQTD